MFYFAQVRKIYMETSGMSNCLPVPMLNTYPPFVWINIWSAVVIRIYAK